MIAKSSAKSTSYQPKIIVSAVEFSTKRKIKIKRVSNQEHTSKKSINDVEQNVWRLSHEVTTQDTRNDGDLRSLEFRGISLADYDNLSLENRQGLREFVETLNLIQEWHPDWNIHIEFMPVPEGTKISRYPSGERRVCAVVKFEILDNQPIWLFEVSRPDQWQISTLIFVEILINHSANSIIKWITPDGHWKLEEFQGGQARVITVRHTDSGIKRWKERLEQKVVGHSMRKSISLC